jgi:hypothetical protein
MAGVTSGMAEVKSDTSGETHDVAEMRSGVTDVTNGTAPEPHAVLEVLGVLDVLSREL